MIPSILSELHVGDIAKSVMTSVSKSESQSPAKTSVMSSMGLFDSMFIEVRDAILNFLTWVKDTSVKLPFLFRECTTSMASILIACAVIAGVGIAVALLVGLFFVHPRPATLSNKTQWDDYMEKTYFPHFLAVRSQLNTDIATLSNLGVQVSFPLMTMNSAIPASDVESVAFLQRYFNCYSAYSDTTSIFGKRIFQLPENVSDQITQVEWMRVENLRQAISDAVKNVPQGLWMSEVDFNGAIKTDLQMNFRNKKASYDSYVAAAQTAARVSASTFEMDMLLNTYHQEIVTRYDSRQQRMYGNPYIWVYYMKATTIDTAAKIKKIWDVGLSENVSWFSDNIQTTWKSFSPSITALPKTLVGFVTQIS